MSTEQLVSRMASARSGTSLFRVEKGYAQPEIYDAQSALIQLGKHYALFTDKVKHEDWRDEAIQFIRDGQLPYEVVAREFGDNLAIELFQRAGIADTMEPAQGAINDTALD